tara:strand:+ start:415 stop:669 length:255 start_codon:yes stop_codon:yes gene_type:complete
MARRTVKKTTRTRRNILTGRTRVTTKTKGAGRRKSKETIVYNRDGSIRKKKTLTRGKGKTKTVSKRGKNVKTILKGRLSRRSRR